MGFTGRYFGGALLISVSISISISVGDLPVALLLRVFAGI
jgi:hypothetical protein